MRKSLFVIIACFSSILCALAQTDGNGTGITVEQLLKNIDKAVDPDDKAQDIKTVISKYEGAVSMQEIKLQITTMFKAPNKSKTVIKAGENMPDGVEIFNGKEAWTIVPGMGARQINGPQLDFMKLTAKMSNPANRMKDLFPKIEMAPMLEKVEGADCYKLICEPEEKLKLMPVAIFIDRKTFLPVKMVIMVFSDMGQIPGTTFYSNYKNLGGIVIATEQKTQTMGMEMTTKLLSVKFNDPIEDFEFEIPEEFNAPPVTVPAPVKTPVVKPLAAVAPEPNTKALNNKKIGKKKKKIKAAGADDTVGQENDSDTDADADADSDDDDDKDKQ